MIKQLSIFILIISLTACSKRLQPSVNTDTKETITNDTVYVPQEKVVIIPGDTVEIYEAIPCPDVTYHKEATSKTGNVKATVNISKGNLTVNCATDSLVQRIQWLEAHSRQVKESKTTITITPPAKRWIPKWVWWLLGFNIIYFGLKLYLKFYKIPFLK